MSFARHNEFKKTSYSYGNFREVIFISFNIKLNETYLEVEV